MFDYNKSTTGYKPVLEASSTQYVLFFGAVGDKIQRIGKIRFRGLLLVQAGDLSYCELDLGLGRDYWISSNVFTYLHKITDTYILILCKYYCLGTGAGVSTARCLVPVKKDQHRQHWISILYFQPFFQYRYCHGNALLVRIQLGTRLPVTDRHS